MTPLRRQERSGIQSVGGEVGGHPSWLWRPFSLISRRENAVREPRWNEFSSFVSRSLLFFLDCCLLTSEMRSKALAKIEEGRDEETWRERRRYDTVSVLENVV